jgi:hypothetical protein
LGFLDDNDATTSSCLTNGIDWAAASLRSSAQFVEQISPRKAFLTGTTLELEPSSTHGLHHVLEHGIEEFSR